MRNYMPKVVHPGPWNMMKRTLHRAGDSGFLQRSGLVKKFRVSLALQPIATALFADSPFTEGKPNGYQSYRSHIWTDTDKDRTACSTSCSRTFRLQRYVDYLLDVPMYFSSRNGEYIDCFGQSSRIS